MAPTKHVLNYSDSTHAYTLNGRRCKSVTAVAKLAQDSWALEQWRKRQIAIGMTKRPDLAERVASAPDNRELLDQVCDEAFVAAGADQAAHRGSQRHRASELSDLGGNLMTQQQRDDAAAWNRTLDKYRITVDPRFVEAFVIWPDYGIAGRLDRVASVGGVLRILDLKSGENAVRYPQSTAVQLALYGYAPLVSSRVVTVGDRSTVTEWEPMPNDLDLSVGNVLLLGDGQEVGSLFDLDIERGWKGAMRALDLLEWRRENYRAAELVRPSTVPVDSSAPVGYDVLKEISEANSPEALVAVWKTATSHGMWNADATEAAKARKAKLTTR